ncbi:GTPase HflX, partial [Candidatus Dependentiae bacterium]|nr:GTPase HflX [Candidatus Dependentiae bacterium]
MKPVETLTQTHPKTLIVGIHSPTNPSKDIQSYYDEFVNLVTSDGIIYDESFFTRLRSIDPAYYLTKGKVEELTELCRKLEIEEVIVSEILSPQQERNLSEILRCRVYDRTQLILEIFEKGAQTAEGKTQVELAMLQHRKSRLAGRGISMSQQAGRIGTRGPGETAKEKELQHIERSSVKLQRDLDKLAKTRETQRKQRLGENVPHICLIGYTNAGKSTILNALTKSEVLAENRLFATLDTTTRELYISKRKVGIISDTVGFIQQLPHNLIEAFKSTLSELNYAHLLLHVIDSADSNWEYHIRVVMEVLKELDIDKPILYVFNKIDMVADRASFERAVEKYPSRVLVSSLSKEGLMPLIEFLHEWEIPQRAK